MGTLLGVIILLGICWWIGNGTDIRFHNYLPPEGQRIDHAKMNRDLVTGVSKDEVKRRTINGYYNTKK